MHPRNLIFALSLPLALPAQSRTLTNADYDRAVKMLGQNVNMLVVGSTVAPIWTPDGKFWYRSARAAGVTFLLVDGAKKTATPLFDHAKLAAALNAASAGTYTATALPFT